MKKIFSYIGITTLALMSFMITSKTTAVIKDANDIISIPNKKENDIIIELAIATNIVIDKVKIIHIQLIKPIVRYNKVKVINKIKRKMAKPITNDNIDELLPKEFSKIVLLNLGLLYNLETC